MATSITNTSITTDDLTVDTNTFKVDHANNHVGFGTATPQAPIDATLAAGGDWVARFQNTTSATPYGVQIYDAPSASNGYPLLQVTNSAGSGTYFRVDSGTGFVTKPYQPAFRVGKTSAQQDSGGTHPLLTFDVIDYNIGNHFDLSTDKFTAPIAGRYLFGWTLGLYRHNSAWMGVYSYKNNTFLDYSQSFAYSTASWHNFDASILVNLAVNDTFHIALQNGSNAAVDNSGCFWGFLVG